MHRIGRGLATIAAIAAVMFAGTEIASANPYSVTNANDTGAGSLRDAQDLNPNTTYECQVTARNKFGEDVSQKRTFRTESGERDTDGDD